MIFQNYWNSGVKIKQIAKPYSWFTTVKEIAENDYILSANTYSPYNGEEESNHRDPKEILKEIEQKENKMTAMIGEMKKQI